MARTMLRMVTAGILLSGFLWAQDDDDQPGRGVARISVLNGEVSVLHGDSGEWVAAAGNAPLVASDHILTGATSQAEVQFDYASFLRMASNSEVRLADLENGHYQVQLSRGTVTVRVLRDPQGTVELDTPSIAVRPVGRGVYRVTLDGSGQTWVTVRSGEAEISSPKGTERLTANRTMLVRGDPQDPEFQVMGELGYDNWDRWNDQRDQDLERSRSYQYVDKDIYGAEDLDNYGRWVNVPPYGTVWCPNGVGADWAPYRAGRWAWVDWYGWTWVSYDPWGWAPYHYGRWFHSGPYGWCWFPGARGRHFWRPGLVAFFGYGRGGVGFGFGSIGWVPLGPYERFHPWYGRGRSFSVVNVRVDSFRNARVYNGVTGIDAHGFARGGRGSMLRTTDFAQRASVMRGPVPLGPSVESRRFVDRQVRTMAPRSEPSHFFSRGGAVRTERMPSDPGWHRFGGNDRPPAARQGLGAYRGPAQPGRPSGFGSSRPDVGWRGPVRGDSPQRMQPQPYGGRGGQIRINPPIVRERPAMRAEPRGPSGGGRAERPQAQPPRNSGGGGGHYNGGGGGGGARGGDHGGHGRSR